MMCDHNFAAAAAAAVYMMVIKALMILTLMTMER